MLLERLSLCALHAPFTVPGNKLRSGRDRMFCKLSILKPTVPVNSAQPYIRRFLLLIGSTYVLFEWKRKFYIRSSKEIDKDISISLKKGADDGRVRVFR